MGKPKTNAVTVRNHAPVSPSVSETPRAVVAAHDLASLPASVVYVAGGTLVPKPPADPDMPEMVIAEVLGGLPDIRGNTHLGRIPHNGLTPRMDAMARMMARGIAGTPAYRAAYNVAGGQIRGDRRHSDRAFRIMKHPRFKASLAAYRAEMERERRQQAVGMRDFVLGRLVHEAQTAPEAAARIKSLDLLGKSEAMWTTVTRNEKTLSPKDVDRLKHTLEQRLRAFLARAGQGGTEGEQKPHNSYYGTSNPLAGQGEEAGGQPEPHPRAIPLITSGFPSNSGDTIPLSHPPHFTEGPTSSRPGGLVSGSPAGDCPVDNGSPSGDDTGGSSQKDPSGSVCLHSEHREMTLEDL